LNEEGKVGEENGTDTTQNTEDNADVELIGIEGVDRRDVEIDEAAIGENVLVRADEVSGNDSEEHTEEHTESQLPRVGLLDHTLHHDDTGERSVESASETSGSTTHKEIMLISRVAQSLGQQRELRVDCEGNRTRRSLIRLNRSVDRSRSSGQGSGVSAGERGVLTKSSQQRP